MSLGERLRQAREEENITQDTLVKNLNRILEVQGIAEKARGRSSVAQWETGRAFPEFQTISAIAKAVNRTPEYLAFGITSEPKVVPPDPDVLGYVLAPEIVVREDGKYVEIQKWGLPVEWLRSELGIRAFKDIAIHKVQVNGDPFDYGDRVIIDRANTKPSPPGYFLYWDGFGANIGKMMIVPGGGRKAMVKVKGPTGGDYEMDVEKLSIIGRVKGVWKKA